MLTKAILAPHPPVLIPTIGRGTEKEVAKTIASLQKLNHDLLKIKPETLVLISSHGPHSPDSLPILAAPALEGNFGNFGDPETILSFKNDDYLTSLIEEDLNKEGISTDLINDPFLDHGTLVPLYYLTNQLPDINLVPIGQFTTDRKTIMRAGKIIGQVLNQSEEKVVFIASGDLSHRLSQDSDGGFAPEGQEFDKKIASLIARKDSTGISNIDPSLVEEAGQCGFNSILALMGLLSNFDYEPHVLSYEAPFGVGYLTADFEIKSKQL